MTATLHNTTGYRITVDFGVDDQTKFVFLHTKPDRTATRTEPSLVAQSRMRTSRLMLRGNAHTAFVVLDEWLDLSQPGPHRIDVEFHGSVGIEGGNEADLKRRASLAIEVKSRNPGRLEKRASDWLKQVSSLSPGFETRAAGVALVSMKDPVVIPYLELATLRTRSQKYADALGEIGGPEARASLARIEASPDLDIRALAQRVLARGVR